MTDYTKPITPEIVEDENEKKDGQLVQQSIKPDILYLIPITGSSPFTGTGSAPSGSVRRDGKKR